MVLLSCSHPPMPLCGLHGPAKFPRLRALRRAPAMAASIGVVAPPAPGAAYYESDGYYAKDDPTHREASR